MEEVIREIFKLAEIIPSEIQIRDVSNLLNINTDSVSKTNMISNYIGVFTPVTYVKLYKLLDKL